MCSPDQHALAGIGVQGPPCREIWEECVAIAAVCECVAIASVYACGAIALAYSVTVGHMRRFRNRKLWWTNLVKVPGLLLEVVVEEVHQTDCYGLPRGFLCALQLAKATTSPGLELGMASRPGHSMLDSQGLWKS